MWGKWDLNFPSGGIADHQDGCRKVVEGGGWRVEEGGRCVRADWPARQGRAGRDDRARTLFFAGQTQTQTGRIGAGRR